MPVDSRGMILNIEGLVRDYISENKPLDYDYIYEHCCPDFSEPVKTISNLTSWEDEGGRPASERSLPKCTKRDEGPFGPHPFRKDDGFVHPNKKY